MDAFNMDFTTLLALVWITILIVFILAIAVATGRIEDK